MDTKRHSVIVISLALFFGLIIFSNIGLAADLGSNKGETFLRINNTDDAYIAYKLTTNSTYDGLNGVDEESWEFNESGAVTFTFYNKTVDNDGFNNPPTPPDGQSGDRFRIVAYYENTTDNIIEFYDSTTGPDNGTNFTFWATADGTDDGHILAYNDDIDSGDGSIRIDSVSEDSIHIAYEELSGNNVYSLKSDDGGETWSRTDTGVGSSDNGWIGASMRNSNEIYISHQDSQGNLTFKKSTNGGSSWNQWTIDSGSLIFGGHIDMDSNDDDIFMVYGLDDDNDGVYSGLRSARSTNGGGDSSNWDTFTFDHWAESGESDNFKNIRVSVVNGTIAYTSYYDSGANEFYVAKYSGNSWTDFVLDSSGNVGFKNDIVAVDKDTVFTAYRDSSNNSLKFAKTTIGSTNASEWEISTIGNELPTDISIDAINSTHVYIAYNDKILKSTDGGSTWSEIAVNGAGESFSVLDEDNAFIAYDGIKFSKIDSGWSDWRHERSGIARIWMYVGSDGGILGDWSADSDDGTLSGSVDSDYAQGYVRAPINITSFKTYSDSNYTQEETEFMRGEAVYMKIENTQSFGNAGNELGLFALDSIDESVLSKNLNLSSNSTNKVSWEIPVDADLDNYVAKIMLSGSAIEFEGEYDDQFSQQNKNLTLTDGKDHVLWNNETHLYDYINISNGSRVLLKEYNGTSGTGELTLKANNEIFIGKNSRIGASGRGYSGGVGGSGCIELTPGVYGNDPGEPGDGPGGGGRGGTDGEGAGGAGHAGNGGFGSSGDGVSGDSYGSETNRVARKGSGGGGGGSKCLDTGKGSGDIQGGSGGDGGGIIVLEADEKITIEGQLIANGANGFDGSANLGQKAGSGGGGSGGTILLNASSMVISKDATISAKGGDSPDDGGGGSGGRIKIFGESLSITSPTGFDGGVGWSPGGDGTDYREAGERWTKLHTSSIGYDTSKKADFGLTSVTDPDNSNITRNASFWVEDELKVSHDFRPRTTFTGCASNCHLVNRGLDTVNFSIVIDDEYNRSFSGKDVDLLFNSTNFEKVLSIGDTIYVPNGSSDNFWGDSNSYDDWALSYTSEFREGSGEGSTSKSQDTILGRTRTSGGFSEVDQERGRHTIEIVGINEHLGIPQGARVDNIKVEYEEKYAAVNEEDKTHLNYRKDFEVRAHINDKIFTLDDLEDEGGSITGGAYIDDDFTAHDSGEVKIGELAGTGENEDKIVFEFLTFAGVMEQTFCNTVGIESTTTGSSLEDPCAETASFLQDIRVTAEYSLPEKLEGTDSQGRITGEMEIESNWSTGNYTIDVIYPLGTERGNGSLGENTSDSSTFEVSDILIISDTTNDLGEQNIGSEINIPVTFKNVRSEILSVQDANVSVNITLPNGTLMKEYSSFTSGVQNNYDYFVNRTDNGIWNIDYSINAYNNSNDGSNPSSNFTVAQRYHEDTHDFVFLEECTDCGNHEANETVYYNRIIELDNPTDENTTFLIHSGVVPCSRSGTSYNTTWDTSQNSGNCSNNRIISVDASEGQLTSGKNTSYRFRIDDDIITIDDSNNWTQDDSQTSDVDTQYVKKENITINNTENVISFTNIDWSISASTDLDGDSTCDNCSGTISSLSTHQSTDVTAYDSGDWINETTENPDGGQAEAGPWEQDNTMTSTIDKQYVRQLQEFELSGINLDGVISLDWNIFDPDSRKPSSGSNCDTDWRQGGNNVTLNGTIKINTSIGSNTTYAETWGDCLDFSKTSESNTGPSYEKFDPSRACNYYYNADVDVNNFDSEISFSDISFTIPVGNETNSTNPNIIVNCGSDTTGTTADGSSIQWTEDDSISAGVTTTCTAKWDHPTDNTTITEINSSKTYVKNSDTITLTATVNDPDSPLNSSYLEDISASLEFAEGVSASCDLTGNDANGSVSCSVTIDTDREVEEEVNVTVSQTDETMCNFVNETAGFFLDTIPPRIEDGSINPANNDRIGVDANAEFTIKWEDLEIDNAYPSIAVGIQESGGDVDRNTLTYRYVDFNGSENLRTDIQSNGNWTNWTFNLTSELNATEGRWMKWRVIGEDAAGNSEQSEVYQFLASCETGKRIFQSIISPTVIQGSSDITDLQNTNVTFVLKDLDTGTATINEFKYDDITDTEVPNTFCKLEGSVVPGNLYRLTIVYESSDGKTYQIEEFTMPEL